MGDDVNIQVPLAIDHDGCGCDDCVDGRSVPMDQANGSDYIAYLQHHAFNRTGIPRDEFDKLAKRLSSLIEQGGE